MISLFRIIDNIRDQVTTAPPLGKVTLDVTTEGDVLWITFEEVKPAGDYEEPIQWKFKLDGK